MKKLPILALGLFLQNLLVAQCGSQVSGGGTATSFLTSFTRGAINPVAADKDLNTVAFIHRTNTVTTGGTFGSLVYDISTNGGTSWTPNNSFLNPTVSSWARFPNVTIYNPPANTNPSNAYIGYMASTVNSVALTYNGVVSGVRQISGVGNTENYNQPVVNPSFIAESLVKGAPGVFWAIDGLYNGTYITGFTVYKGVWNSSTNDIAWSNNFNVSPSFNTGFTPTGAVPADYNIAFDPTGTTGYISFMGHLASGPAGFAYYPILYKTTNGGNTWTGPIVVDVNQFSCLTSNVGVGNIASAGFEHDLVVDVNGNPHLVTVLINGNNAYAVYYGLWHHIFDITLKNGLWAAYDLGNLNAGRATWGVAPNSVSLDIFPRIARSVDGTKIFYTWADNATYIAGAANLTPNLFSKAYNVTTDMWTPTKDFTSCNPAINGKILFPHLAPEVLEPSAGAYKLATVYGEFSTGANDPLIDVNFKFLDNATYAVGEFSVPTPAAMVNIQPGPSLLLCPTSAVTLSLTNTQGQFLWSTGATTSTISITSGTATSYSVVAQQACLIGTANISVTNMSLNLNPTVQNICTGSSGNYSVTGNASGYTWTPGNATGTNVVIVPTVNTITVTASGSGCVETKTVGVNILPQPTLSITGNNTICATTILTLNVTGAQTYVWDNNTTNSTFTDTPLTSTNYFVIGTAANTCTNVKSINVSVLPSPTVNALVSETVICIGKSVSIIGTGAVSFSLDGVSSPAVISVTPNATTIYSLTGAGSNLCENTRTINIVVNALPTLTITQAKAKFCKGEKIKLTAAGAVSYVWSAPGSLSSTIQVNPIVNTTYTVTGKNAEGCENSQTLTLVVDPCTGIENITLNTSGLSVYPNPNNGRFTIKSDEAMQLNLLNELGQLVQVININESNAYEVSLKDVPAGIYFIVGQKDNQFIKEKIIINN